MPGRGFKGLNKQATVFKPDRKAGRAAVVIRTRKERRAGTNETSRRKPKVSKAIRGGGEANHRASGRSDPVSVRSPVRGENLCAAVQSGRHAEDLCDVIDGRRFARHADAAEVDLM